jgi:hypothetical protein
MDTLARTNPSNRRAAARPAPKVHPAPQRRAASRPVAEDWGEESLAGASNLIPLDKSSPAARGGGDAPYAQRGLGRLAESDDGVAARWQAAHPVYKNDDGGGGRTPARRAHDVAEQSLVGDSMFQQAFGVGGDDGGGDDGGGPSRGSSRGGPSRCTSRGASRGEVSRSTPSPAARQAAKDRALRTPRLGTPDLRLEDSAVGSSAAAPARAQWDRANGAQGYPARSSLEFDDGPVRSSLEYDEADPA